MNKKRGKTSMNKMVILCHWKMLKAQVAINIHNGKPYLNFSCVCLLTIAVIANNLLRLFPNQTRLHRQLLPPYEMHSCCGKISNFLLDSWCKSRKIFPAYFFPLFLLCISSINWKIWRTTKHGQKEIILNSWKLCFDVPTKQSI